MIYNFLIYVRLTHRNLKLLKIELDIRLIYLSDVVLDNFNVDSQSSISLIIAVSDREGVFRPYVFYVTHVIIQVILDSIMKG